MQTGVETFEDGNPSSFCLPCLCLAPGLKAAAASCKVVVELWYLLRRAAQSVSQSVRQSARFPFRFLAIVRRRRCRTAVAPVTRSFTHLQFPFLPSFLPLRSIAPSFTFARSDNCILLPVSSVPSLPTLPQQILVSTFGRVELETTRTVRKWKNFHYKIICDETTLALLPCTCPYTMRGNSNTGRHWTFSSNL